MLMKKIKLFRVTSVYSGFILIVIILIILITGNFKIDESWRCRECCSTIFHFISLLLSNKNFLTSCTSTDGNTMQSKELRSGHHNSLLLKP